MTFRSWIAGAIVCVVASGAAAQSVKKESDPSAPAKVHGFNVALVLGEMQGGSTLETLPQAAKKALVDMRDFLPYKSYRMLDSQWILCCGGSKLGEQPVVSGRLRGVDDQQYAFSIEVHGGSPLKLSLGFWLRELFDPVKKTPSKSAKDPEPGDVQRQLEETLRAFGSKQGAVIDSTFSMDVGETVVIGTSSLKGEKALIALLTAAKRPGSQPSSTLGEKR
jgi:hypothetical protein